MAEFTRISAPADTPEPSLGEDDLPVEFEPIADALETYRREGVSSVKATDFKKFIGEKLAPHLRGSKAFLEALRHLEGSHGIVVRPYGPGKTAHVFFLEEPTSSI